MNITASNVCMNIIAADIYKTLQHRDEGRDCKLTHNANSKLHITKTNNCTYHKLNTATDTDPQLYILLANK